MTYESRTGLARIVLVAIDGQNAGVQVIPFGP